jgi:hypothetical protein
LAGDFVARLTQLSRAGSLPHGFYEKHKSLWEGKTAPIGKDRSLVALGSSYHERPVGAGEACNLLILMFSRLQLAREWATRSKP